MSSVQLVSIFVMVLLALGCKNDADSRASTGQDAQEKLTLSKVIHDAKASRSGAEGHATVARFRKFDFAELTALDPVKEGEGLDVFLNDRNEIIKVATSKGFSEESFEFQFLRNRKDNYTILLINYVNSGGTREDVNGFIVNVNHKSYFITYDDHPLCVMQLDAGLKVISTIRTLKFHSDSMYYKTNVNYDDDGMLNSETFYTAEHPLAINVSTLLQAVTAQFDSDLGYHLEMKLKLGIHEADKHLPLWLWNGHQEYDVEATPATKSLEVKDP